MKVRASVKAICENCYPVIRRRKTKRIKFNRCPNPKHNQRQG